MRERILAHFHCVSKWQKILYIKTHEHHFLLFLLSEEPKLKIAPFYNYIILLHLKSFNAIKIINPLKKTKIWKPHYHPLSQIIQIQIQIQIHSSFALSFKRNSRNSNWLCTRFPFQCGLIKIWKQRLEFMNFLIVFLQQLLLLFLREASHWCPQRRINEQMR